MAKFRQGDDRCERVLEFAKLASYTYKINTYVQTNLIDDQGFKNWKSWYTFFRAPNNMFAYTIVHLTFRAPQIVVRACVRANLYLVVHLLQRYIL